MLEDGTIIQRSLESFHARATPVSSSPCLAIFCAATISPHKPVFSPLPLPAPASCRSLSPSYSICPVLLPNGAILQRGCCWVWRWRVICSACVSGCADLMYLSESAQIAGSRDTVKCRLPDSIRLTGRLNLTGLIYRPHGGLMIKSTNSHLSSEVRGISVFRSKGRQDSPGFEQPTLFLLTFPTSRLVPGVSHQIVR